MSEKDQKDNKGTSFDESNYLHAEPHEIGMLDPFARAQAEAAKEARKALPEIIQEVRGKIKNVKGAKMSIGKEDFFVEEETLSALEEMIPTLPDEEIVDLRHQFEVLSQSIKPVFDAIEIEPDQLREHILGDLKWFQKEFGKEKGNITAVMKAYEIGSLINEGQVKTAQGLGLMDDMHFGEALEKLETKNTEEALRFALNLIEAAKERQGIESSKQVKKDMKKMVGLPDSDQPTSRKATNSPQPGSPRLSR